MLSSVIRLFRTWQRYDAGFRELSLLPDRELADIGLNRSDISRVAWHNAYQRS
jgi:uncharacterized protein YjiS (DUF1127 family)